MDDKPNSQPPKISRRIFFDTAVLSLAAVAGGLAIVGGNAVYNLREIDRRGRKEHYPEIESEKPVAELFNFIRTASTCSKEDIENFFISHPAALNGIKGTLNNVGVAELGNEYVTVLDYAVALERSKEVIETLLQYGAEPTVKSFEYLRDHPFSTVRSGQTAEITAMLKNRFPAIEQESRRELPRIREIPLYRDRERKGNPGARSY